MYNIRKGIFETNSSSVHVLCINKTDLHVHEKFVFDNSGEFGWPSDTYCDEYSKGSYLYHIIETAAWTNAQAKYMELHPDYKGPTYGITDPEFKKLEEDYNQEYKDKITNILNEYGCNDVTWKWYTDNIHAGYLDHSYEAIEFLNDMLECPELLIHFLFGDGMIVTGNDNDDNCPDAGDYKADYVFEKGN